MNEKNIITCRARSGAVIAPSKEWRAGEAVEFIYCPQGQHKITAGFRENDSITINVIVDDETPGVLQASFDDMVRSSKQEPYSDEDHQGKKATLRFPATTRFSWGEIRGVAGVVISGAVPTGYGARCINGADYKSWSPEFSTDAAMDEAEFDEKRRHWSFPAFARGSEQNPARLTGVNFVVGALTNRPAFKEMPFVKAKAAAVPARTSAEVLNELAARRDASRRLLEQAAKRAEVERIRSEFRSR
jgi:hypothetical protein